MARFIRLGEHPVSVKMYAEVIGADTLEIREDMRNGRISWPEWDPFDSRPRPDGKGVFDPALHLYLSGKTNDTLNTVSLDRKKVEEFVLSATNGKIASDSYFYKLQFRRKIDAQVVCFRPSDEKPMVNGFGMENSRGRKCDPLHSELYVDRRPGTVFTKYNGSEKVGEEVWEGFKPVYLKIKPADGSAEYYLKVWTEWCDSEIFVKSETTSSDVPNALLGYQFQERLSSGSREPDPFEVAAIKKYRHSSKIRK